MLVWKALMLLILQKYELMNEIPVKTLLPPMNVVSELGAEVVEGELVGLPVDHHLPFSHPECRTKTAIGIPRNLRPSENEFLDSASNFQFSKS